MYINSKASFGHIIRFFGIRVSLTKRGRRYRGWKFHFPVFWEDLSV